MTRLPFLIVYGAWIAKLLVVACGALIVVAMLRWRQRKERRETALMLDRWPAPTRSFAPGAVTLRGILSGDAATLAENPRAGGLPSSHHSRVITLEVGGERIVMQGAITVLRGTAAAAAWRGFPAGTPEILTHDLPGWNRRWFSVKTGDEVIVQGTLSRRTADAEYRESAAVWTLQPSGGCDAIELLAARPKIQPPALDPIRFTAVVAVWLAVAYGGLHVVGTAMAKNADHGVADDKRVADHIDRSLELAAALPGSRDEALRLLEYQLDYEFPQDEPTLELRYAAAQLRSGCRERAELQLDHGRYADALDCPDPRTRSRALLLLGRYAEAEQAFAQLPPSDDQERVVESGIAAIGAGHWTNAAEIAEAAAKRSAPAGDADDALIAAVAHGRMTCFAIWFRVRGGDMAAATRLAQLAADPESATVCKIFQALQLPPAEGIKALEATREIDRRFELGERSFADNLLWATTDHDDSLELWNIVSVLARGEPDDKIWLVPEVKDRMTVRATAAIRAMLRGDMLAARAEAEKARLLPAESSAFDDLDALEAAIRLHTPATGLARVEPKRSWAYEDLDAELALRDKQKPEKLHLSAYRCTRDLEAALLTTARDGDGALLAGLMARCNLFGGAEGSLIAIAPLVTTHREQLASAIRIYGDADRADRVPFRLAVDAMQRRDLAHLIGDDASAVRWQAIIDAHSKVLGDRDKAIAFMAWDLL